MRSTSLMALIGLALVALLAGAEALNCAHAGRPISCCQDLRSKQSGGLILYKCNKCDNGFKPSSDKQQCKPANVCKPGFGWNLYSDKCARCSDKNCKDCSAAFYSCTQCKKGYISDPSGVCQRVLL